MLKPLLPNQLLTAPCTVALLVATPTGEIRYVHADARRLMKRFFPRPSRAGVLPRKMRHWLASGGVDTAARSLITERGGVRLFVRKHKPYPPDAVTLLLEVVEDRAARLPRRQGTLTARQTEVLHWVTCGKGNQQIAEILGISLGTVRKHLEHVFDKFGVDNRTEATNSYNGSVVVETVPPPTARMA